MVRRALAATALVVGALSTSGAQEPRRLAEAESIPLELAAALANSGGFGGEPQILVGSMPEWVSNRLIVPKSGHVLGSAFLGTTVVAVVTVPGEPDSALVTLRGELLQRGWVNPPPPPIYGGGGFRPAPTAASSSSTSASRTPLCNDQQMLIITAARRRMGGSDVIYRMLSVGSGYNACRPPQPPAQTYRSPFPTLYNPPSTVDAYASGCQMNNAMNGTGTQLRSSMTPEALLDHYGRQIIDSGWTAAPGQILGRTWTKKDSTGTPIEMTLTVIPMGKDPSCQRLELQVRTPPKP